MDLVRVEQLDDSEWADASERWLLRQCFLDFGSSDGTVTVTQERIDVLKAAPLIDNVSFSSAVFADGDVDFESTRFGDQAAGFVKATFGDGYVSFKQARFRGGVYFSSADFGDGFVNFYGTEFGAGDVSFDRATFGEGTVNFDRATFGTGNLTFNGANFGDGDVAFSHVDFGHGDVTFEMSSFQPTSFGEGRLVFDHSTFGDGDLSFRSADFGDGAVSFEGTHFGDGSVNFTAATFGKGPVGFDRARFGNSEVMFDGAKFSGNTVHCREASFGDARVAFTTVSGLRELQCQYSRWKTCDLEVTQVGGDDVWTKVDLFRSVVAGGCRITLGNVDLHANQVTFRAPGEIRAGFGMPRLVTLRDADVVGSLRIGRHVDVGGTEWGDQDLTRIELAATDTLRAKSGRRILAGDPRVAVDDGGGVPLVDDAVLERNYRDLRVRLEAIGSTHTANDFYFGEMDSRRRRIGWRKLERWLLSSYRVVSSYGTRAWSALAVWVGVTVAFALLILSFGTRVAPQTLGDALVSSASTSLSFFRPTDTGGLPTWLQGVALVVRVVGPILFGLAALATRNRVKR